MANMEWMYKRPTIDAEAYLTGKPIDKSIELLENPDGVPTSSEDIGGRPGALFLEAAASAALGAEAKLREDPLYAIKKKEEEQRRALLNNPVRLKMMQEELEKKERSKDKKKQKHMKEDDLIAKMMRLKEKFGTDLKDLLTDGNHTGLTSSRSHHNTSSSRISGHSKGHGSPHSSSRRRFSHSEERKRRRSRSMDRNTEAQARHADPRDVDGSRSSITAPRENRSVNFSRAPSKAVMTQSSSAAHLRSRKSLPKLDPEEIARKRREMMDDAKSRDLQRYANVTTYQKHDAEEEEKNKTAASSSAGGFIRPLLVKATETDTLETRLQSNRNKLQRTTAALDKNFSRR